MMTNAAWNLTIHDNRHTSQIAVFDLDRTLLKRTSGEARLIRFLRIKNLMPLSKFFYGFLWMLVHLYKGLTFAVLKNKMYLRDLNVRELHDMLPEFFDHYIRNALVPQFVKRIGQLRNQGYEIIIISGSLDFIVTLLAERLGADHGIGSAMEIKNEHYTGMITGPYIYRHEKVKALMRYLGKRKIDFEKSVGFGDSWADVPLLSLFGKPIAANPGRLLRRTAAKRGWTIEDYSI